MTRQLIIDARLALALLVVALTTGAGPADPPRAQPIKPYTAARDCKGTPVHVWLCKNHHVACNCPATPPCRPDGIFPVHDPTPSEIAAVTLKYGDKEPLESGWILDGMFFPEPRFDAERAREACNSGKVYQFSDGIEHVWKRSYDASDWDWKKEGQRWGDDGGSAGTSTSKRAKAPASPQNPGGSAPAQSPSQPDDGSEIVHETETVDFGQPAAPSGSRAFLPNITPSAPPAAPSPRPGGGSQVD